MKYIFLCLFLIGLSNSALAQNSQPEDIGVKDNIEHVANIKLEQNFELFRMGAEYKGGTYLGDIVFIKPSDEKWEVQIGSDRNYAWPYLKRATFSSLNEEEFLTLLTTVLDVSNSKNLSISRINMDLRLIEPLWTDVLSSIRIVAQTQTGTIGMKEIELRSEFDQVFATSPVIKSVCDLFRRKGYKCERVSSSHGFNNQYQGKPWTAILEDVQLGIRNNSRLHFNLVPL